MTARSSNHSFSDGWLVMLQRICPVRLQSGRDPEFEHPEPCLFPIRRKIPKFGVPSWPQTNEPKELVNGIVLALQRWSHPMAKH